VETPSKKELLKENARLKQELALMQQKLDLLLRRMFGQSSEKLSPDQLELFLQPRGDELGKVPASSLEEADPRHEKKKARRARSERWPGDLPVVEQIIEPQEVVAAPQDWRLIGAEVSEQLDYEPAKFYRRRVVRRKYVHRSEMEQAPVIAPLPASLQERCVAAPGLLSAVIVGKYCDHLPLYRQEMIFASRHGVHLPRQSLARWMGLAADWLRPIYELIRTGIMGGGYVQVDETPVRYLSPGHGQTKLGYLWTALSPGGDVVYRWETSRAARCLDHVMAADFQGTIQCDGYAAYPSFAKQRENITLAGCWAHARRTFHEALEYAPQQAGWILRQIRALYRVEADLREGKYSPLLRQRERASRSAMIQRRIFRALAIWKKSGRFLPRSNFGKAIDYTLGSRQMLSVYLEDGRLEIDNNQVENAIRPTALGKKNWLFIGEAAAGERSAILYTIIESCRRRGIDPLAYLRDVLTRLPSATNWTVHELTPENWAKSAQASVQAAA
jgi:transposase